jgi:hypothetical protein
MTAPTAVEISWAWDWVPAGADRAGWIEFMAKLLDDWAGEQVAAARAAWPADSAGEFPFQPGAMGTAVARDLLERADALPAGCRLIWGAGFVDDQVRWLPLLVLAEFREPRPGDPAYLMSMVGAEGRPGDVRPPHIEYLSTDHGDGVRVIALARDENEDESDPAAGMYGRVTAALRLERPDGDVDVLLEARVSGMELLGVIGPGVEAVLHLIAGQSAELRFVPPTGQDLA